MRILITLLILSLWTQAFSQTGTCGDPSPLCVLNKYDYPLGSNIALTPGNSYGCISQTTNGVAPVMGYFYAEIRSTGPITLKFTSNNNLSVAAWGPFADVATAAGTCGTLPDPIACSADINSSSETITISGQVGDIFLIFVKGLAPPAYVGQFSVSQTNHAFPSSGALGCSGFGNQVISCPGNISLIECFDDIPSPHETVFDFVAAGGNVDNLCTDRIAVTFDEFENGGNGCTGSPRILERKYYLQDQCGNLATCSQQFSYPILDEPLELVCPASDAPTQLVTCLDDLEVNVQDITALNACGLDLDFDIGEPIINDASLGIECDLTCLHYPVTVTDECGRVGECTLSFTVFGNVPEFVFDESEINEECKLAPLEINCADGIEGELENYLDTLSVFSTCGNRMELSTTYDVNNFVNVCSNDVYQTQEIIITAKDACGRTNTCRAIINVTKTEAPRIVTDAKDKWVSCSENVDSIFQAYIEDNGGANAIDFCSATTFTTNPINPQFFVSCDDEDGLSIEFIASDDCGNSNITIGVFKVMNDIPITVATEPMDVEVECNDDVDATFDSFLTNQAGATLNTCGNVTFTTIPENPTLPTINDQCDDASIDVSFVGTDDCGQVITLMATFTLVDNTAPILSGGDDLDLVCTGSYDDEVNNWLNNNGNIMAGDICTNVTITNDLDLDVLDDECLNDPVTVTFTVTDACGNSTSQTQTITVTDNTPPVFTFIPTDINEDPTAEDECSEVTITFTDMMNGGQTIRTYTATDACGNETSVTVTFGEIDNTPPVITFIPPTIGCDGVLDPNEVTATDDNGPVTITVTLISDVGTCDTGYTYIYEVIATDAAGNETTQTVSYNIPADNTPPVFTSVPENLTFFCSEEILIPEAIATDDCDEVTITCVTVLNTGAVVDNCNNGFGYDIFKTWTATDACGNTATAVTEAWVVPDTYVGPKFAFVPESKTMECGQDAAFGEAVCETACGDVVLTFKDEIIQGDCSQTGEMIRTWTGIDDCGNVTTAQQIITIPPDMEAPVFTYIPESKTIQDMDDMVFGSPLCEDNCATINHLDIDYTDEPLAEGCGLTRTWVVADMCGNATEASQTFYFDDKEAPSFTGVPEVIELKCGETGTFSDPDITDNMSEVEVVVYDQESEDNCAGLPLRARTWTAIDDCGNVSSFTQTILTTDQEAPVFAEMSSDIVLTCSDEFDFDQAIATDNCSDIQSLDYVDIDLSDDNCISCIYRVQRTWTAVDACGNEASISQTITLTDTEAPSIAISGEAIVEYTCGEELTIEMPIALDNCGDAAITFEDKSDTSACSNGESFTRTWIATDNMGNESRATQQYISTDNEAPVFAEEPFYIESVCDEMFEFITPQVTDACSDVEITHLDQSFDTDCGVGAKLSRTWTATDACGNVNVFTQTIEITDNEGPVFGQELDNIVLKCGDEIPGLQNVNVTAVDNCDQNVEIWVDESVYPETDCSEDPILSRTYTATDDCGNMTVMTYDIFREADTEHPTLMNTIEDKEIFCGQEVEFDLPSFEDNCVTVMDLSSVTDTEEDACSMSQIRTWTATDNCGNATEVSQRIYWVDEEAPEILFPLVSLELSIDEYLAWAANPVVDAEDSCSGVDDDATVVNIVENENCEDFRVSYTYSITDNCGNQNEIDFEVYVPNTLPSFELDAPQEVDCGATFTASALDIDTDDNLLEWSLNDPSGTWEVITTTDNQIEIIAGDGTAELLLTATNKLGCATTHSQDIVCALVNSMKNLTAINELELRPNPVVDILTIQFTSSENLDAEFIVYDLLGRVLIQQSHDIISGDNQFEVNAATLQQGTYILEIATKKGSAVKKFMKF